MKTIKLHDEICGKVSIITVIYLLRSTNVNTDFYADPVQSS